MPHRRVRYRFFVAITTGLIFICALGSAAAERVQVGSKAFTESVILGELATQIGHEAGFATVHRSQLGGTRVLWEALLGGQLDVYPEYTGTIVEELLPGTPTNDGAIRDALQKRGIGMTQSLGFSDNYALGVSEGLASRFHLQSISELAKNPGLRFGFSNEFLERRDGWPIIRSRYGLEQSNVIGLDHDLAYRAISSGSIDVIDLYSTDAEIAYYHLRVLDDDKHVLPKYEAVYLYRLELQSRSPGFVTALGRLQGSIDVASMREMNAASKLQKQPEGSLRPGSWRRILE